MYIFHMKTKGIFKVRDYHLLTVYIIHYNVIIFEAIVIQPILVSKIIFKRDICTHLSANSKPTVKADSESRLTTSCTVTYYGRKH